MISLQAVLLPALQQLNQLQHLPSFFTAAAASAPQLQQLVPIFSNSTNLATAAYLFHRSSSSNSQCCTISKHPAISAAGTSHLLPADFPQDDLKDSKTKIVCDLLTDLLYCSSSIPQCRCVSVTTASATAASSSTSAAAATQCPCISNTIDSATTAYIFHRSSSSNS